MMVSRSMIPLFVLLALPLNVAVAGDAPPPDAAAAPTATGDAPAAPSMRAYRDPKTGAWTSRPVDPARAATARGGDPALSKSSEGLVVEYMADGSERVDLRGRFQHEIRVVRGPDGALRYGCNDASHAPH